MIHANTFQNLYIKYFRYFQITNTSLESYQPIMEYIMMHKKYSIVYIYNDYITFAEPLAVFTNPLSQMVDVEERVTFSCSFQNARSYRWYKDSVPILGSENRSPLVINPALAEDQGYYYCTAVGEDGTTLSTKQALLTVNG